MGDMLGLPDTEIPLHKQPSLRPRRSNILKFWNQGRINRLTELWNQGLSASQIGKELGATRNAVIGKAFRLNLPSREPRAWPEGEAREPRPRKPRKPRMKRSIAPQAPQELPPAAPLPPKRTKPVGFEDLADYHCRYIVSPDGQDTLFCGTQKQDGFPYCAYHARRCYNMPSR